MLKLLQDYEALRTQVIKEDQERTRELGLEYFLLLSRAANALPGDARRLAELMTALNLELPDVHRDIAQIGADNGR